MVTRRAAARLLPWAPALAVLLLAVLALLWTRTPPTDILRYAAYFALAVMLPGTLVYRSLRGRPRTLVEDLAMGCGLGLVLELAAAALYTNVHLRSWLWTWPVIVIVVFAAVPRLRRHWWVRGYSPVPLRWSWAVAGIAGFAAIYLTVVYLSQNPLPPATFAYYPDLLYHIGLAAQAQRSIPPHDPEIAGGSFAYHWFVNVHLGAAGTISGVPLPTVLLRLWIIPIAVLGIVMVAIVGWRLTGRQWVGVLAAPLFWAIGEFNPWSRVNIPFGAVMNFSMYASPSQSYTYVVLLPAVLMLADRIAPRRDAIGRGAWPLAALFLLASSGAKSTNLPILFCGVFFLIAVRLFARRRVPLRCRVPTSWYAAAALVVAVLLLAQVALYSGSSHGLRFGPLGVIVRSPAAAAMGGPRSGDSIGVLLSDHAMPVIITIAVVLWLVSMLSRLLGVGLLLNRRRRRLNPVQLMLIGCVGGALAATLIFDHPGMSEIYFLRCVFPLAAILSAWGLAEALPTWRRNSRIVWWLIVSILVTAVIVGTYAVQFSVTPPPSDRWGAVWAFVLPTVVIAGVGVLVVAGWFALRRRKPAVVGLGLVVASVIAMYGLGAATFPVVLYPAVKRIVPGGPVTSYSYAGPWSVTAAEARAGQWLNRHSRSDDRVATNVHCTFNPGARHCEARMFLATAFTGRPVLLGSWGYSNEALDRSGQGGVGAWFQPFWDRNLQADNDRVFTDPTPDSVRLLREKYGVRWLFADSRGGTVSPVLGSYATLRHTEGTVSIYRLN